MNHEARGELVELGLSPTEAQIYLALLQNASVSASALAGATGLSRSRVYQTLCSLTDKGLVESGAGYGSKFGVVAPEQALPALIEREQETLAQRRDLAGQLGQRLAALIEPIDSAPEELIQVLRNSRAVAERFDRLQLEAERQIDSFIKAPFFCRPSNPAQEKAQRRGVRVRSLYERSVLEDGSVKPYLEQWVAAGEEARIYDGELPHKLAIFDRKIVLMPLIMPGDQTRTVLIRHPQLAQSLRMFFEFLWEDAAPVGAAAPQNGSSPVVRQRGNKRKPRVAARA